MVLETGAIIKGILIFANRAVSWVGGGYFLRKGLRERKRRYLIVALVLSTAMLLLLLALSGGTISQALVHGPKGWFN